MNIEQLKIIVELISQLSDNAILGLAIYLFVDFLKSLIPGVVITIVIIKIVKIIRNALAEKSFIQYIFRLMGADAEYWYIEAYQKEVIEKLEQKLRRKNNENL